MSSRLILYPVLVQVLLTMTVYILLNFAKARALRRGEVDLARRALHDDAWPDSVVKINNNVIYGNKGNDFLEVYGQTNLNGQFILASNNTIYGGQGDDDDELFAGNKKWSTPGRATASSRPSFRPGTRSTAAWATRTPRWAWAGSIATSPFL